MLHVMFDIDGTLVDSSDVDTRCFTTAVWQVTGKHIDSDWSQYQHATDAGIVKEFIERQGFNNPQEVSSAIKRVFVALIEQSLKNEPLREIEGANQFVSYLRSLPDVVISFATGGWYESAALKLQSAGINYQDLVLASSDAAIDRIGIMNLSRQQATAGKDIPVVYFGDGIWDKNACEALGIDFVLVGDDVDHQPAIMNYRDIDAILTLLSLRPADH